MVTSHALDETDRSQVAINAIAMDRLSPRDGADHVETQVLERQRLATSLEVIVMLVQRK